MDFILGIDIGSTFVKVIIINRSGKFISSPTQKYPLLSLKPDWAEQNPNDLYKSTLCTIKSNVSPKIISIGLSGQMNGSIIIDKKLCNKEVIWIQN